MTRNVGRSDRILRIAFGLGLIAMVFIGPKTSLGWIGIIPLITGLIGNCPAYSLFGFSTCPKSSR
jgi:membrane protein implicated in regulation of membrane protease activity